MIPHSWIIKCMNMHVWYRRKRDGCNPKQYETMEDGTDGW